MGSQALLVESRIRRDLPLRAEASIEAAIITNIILRSSGLASCTSKVKQDGRCIQHETVYLKAGTTKNQEWFAAEQ